MTNLKVSVFVFLLAFTFVCAYPQTVKDKERFEYVSKQLGLSKEVKNKLKPIFFAYRRDLRSAKDIYNNVKEKNITAIKKKTLTPDQARALNQSHWISDAKIVEIRKSYTTKFSTVLDPQQVYYLFSYANDSKEKRSGK